jgi:hypothetical protein
MVVPKITSTQRGNLYSDTGTTTIQTGSVIYNTTLDRFQGRTGTTGWTDFVMGSGGNISVGIITASGAISDGIGNVRDYPQNSQSTAGSDYTLASTDVGKHVYITNTSNDVIVPSDVFSIGDVVLIVNATTNTLTVDNSGLGGATIRLAGSTNTAPHNIPAYGIGFLLCVASNTFILHGVGIS